jgi:glycosyltransferase involved in cell wall biosynthesis
LLAAEGLQYKKDCDLVIANNGTSIAGAIAGLNADPERRARIASRGRHLFEERYTWQTTWRALDKAIATFAGTVRTSTDHSYTEDADANSR